MCGSRVLSNPVTYMYQLDLKRKIARDHNVVLCMLFVKVRIKSCRPVARHFCWGFFLKKCRGPSIVTVAWGFADTLTLRLYNMAIPKSTHACAYNNLNLVVTILYS